MRLLFVELPQLATVHHDQVGLAEREANLHTNQRRERGFGVRCGLHAVAAAGQQLLAHVGEHRRQQRLLAGEVPVDGGAAHTGRGADVVDAGRPVAALGEQAGRSLLDLFGTRGHEPPPYEIPNDRSATVTQQDDTATTITSCRSCHHHHRRPRCHPRSR